MENDHPRAMDFLRMDCRNVTAFFKKKGAQPAAARSLFDFIIDSDLEEQHQEERLKVRPQRRRVPYHTIPYHTGDERTSSG